MASATRVACIALVFGLYLSIGRLARAEVPEPTKAPKQSWSFPCRPLADGQRVHFDVDDAPLADIVRAATCATARNVLFQESLLAGKTQQVVSTREYSATELWALMELALAGHGLGLQRRGAYWSVVSTPGGQDR